MHTILALRRIGGGKTRYSHGVTPLRRFNKFVSFIISNKPAFTLAEVLITLGIVGVIAAMTIPMLITNYQKHLTLVRLKKTYSHLNQVIKLIDEEHGLTVLSGSSSNFVPKYILPHYNGATLYKPTNYKKTMCFNPKHYYLSAPSNDAQYNALQTRRKGKCSGYISTPFGSSASIELPDGTCIAFNTLVDSRYYPNATIFVDVNGSANPPNCLGKDLFMFYVDQDTASVLPTRVETSYDQTKYGAYKIIKDGWRFAKDYPW